KRLPSYVSFINTRRCRSAEVRAPASRPDEVNPRLSTLQTAPDIFYRAPVFPTVQPVPKLAHSLANSQCIVELPECKNGISVRPRPVTAGTDRRALPLQRTASC